MKSNDQSIFASEEYIHVWYELVICNKKETEYEEWSVLQNDIDEDFPNIDGATDFFGSLEFGWILSSFGRIFAGGQKNRKLK